MGIAGGRSCFPAWRSWLTVVWSEMAKAENTSLADLHFCIHNLVSFVCNAVGIPFWICAHVLRFARLHMLPSRYHCSGAEMQGEFASIDSERWFALVMEVTLCLPGNKKARQRGGHRLAGPGCGHTASNPASFRTTANSMSLCNLVQSCISCVISR